MTPAERAEARARHRPIQCTDTKQHCWYEGCDSEWPCDAISALDALDAAEADAERLAEQLRRLHVNHDHARRWETTKVATPCPHTLAACEPLAALAAHEARTRG